MIFATIILCRYIRNTNCWKTYIKYDKIQPNRDRIPDYAKESTYNYFTKGAMFKRCFIVFIMLLPLFVVSVFILMLSINYLVYAGAHLNSWKLIGEAYDLSIKNDPSFLMEIGAITGGIIIFALIVTLIVTIKRTRELSKDLENVYIIPERNKIHPTQRR